jgi:hypothetical protein
MAPTRAKCVSKNAASAQQDVSAELARRLEYAQEQQRAISSVLRAVAKSAGLQPVLDEVVEAATRLCRAENAELYLPRGKMGEVTDLAGSPHSAR